ncbi:MAG: membrane-bound O-acyltransferase family protein, partial [Proteobacteria bacterium]
MLFNSYTFLFLFLPLVLAVSFVLALRSTPLAVAWLVLASFFFYGWGSARHVLLLAGSIAFNHALGEAIARRGGKAGGRAFVLLCVAVAANLAVLGWFKYAGFFIANTNALLGATMRVETIVLPLGISFFTFTQIAYLVDVYRQPVHYRLAPYALFVAYFPHLIAGPILHHRDMLPQFAAPASFRLDFMNLAAGVTLFAIGLFKKTVLADAIAPYVSPVFEQATRGYAP